MSSSSAEERLDLLLKASRLLSSKLELSELLTTMMEMAAKVVGAESASILLVDPRTRELYFDVALDLQLPAKRIRLKPGQGIAGWVAENGEPLIVNDVGADPRWTAKVDQTSGVKTRSVLAAPMLLKGSVIGVVEAINKPNGPFDARDLKHFEAFASQCAVAIENARLFSSLRQEMRNLQELFDTMDEGALFTDQKGQVLLANQASRKLLDLKSGFLQSGLKGLRSHPPVDAILHGEEDLASFDFTRDKPKLLVLSGRAIRMETTGARGSDSTKGWVWIFRDVTETRVEDRLKASFLSLISHKLRTPLAAVLGYSQLLLDGSSPPEFTRRALRSVHRQGVKLNRLVDKLINFVTLEEMERRGAPKTHVELDKLVDEALHDLHELLAERKPAVKRNYSNAQVWGNGTLLKHVIANLVENAVKFNESESPKVDISLEDEGDEVRIRIADNGPGIPPEDHERIFEKFHQVEESFTGQVDGWGLGLPLARKVAEAHGSELALESKLGRGTKVSFSLPKHKAKGKKSDGS